METTFLNEHESTILSLIVKDPHNYHGLVRILNGEARRVGDAVIAISRHQPVSDEKIASVAAGLLKKAADARRTQSSFNGTHTVASRYEVV